MSYEQDASTLSAWGENCTRLTAYLQGSSTSGGSSNKGQTHSALYTKLNTLLNNRVSACAVLQ
jgi:hypothetical protein